MTTEMIDTHLHLWERSKYDYSWIPDGSLLDDDFTPERVLPQMAQAGVTSAVLVQVGDFVEDTQHMLSLATQHSFIEGVVGWIPLNEPLHCLELIEEYGQSPQFTGVRCLSHDYEDDKWLLRDDVQLGMKLLAPAGLTLDLVCTTAQHLANALEIAKEHPTLRIVIDHLAKPDIAHDSWEPWAGLISSVAQHQHVHIKLSGLNTASRQGQWNKLAWQPYVDHALNAFGPSRLMLGSDWPVATLDGDYETVWATQLATVEQLSAPERTQVMSSTARNFYSLSRRPS